MSGGGAVKDRSAGRGAPVLQGFKNQKEDSPEKRGYPAGMRFSVQSLTAWGGTPPSKIKKNGCLERPPTRTTARQGCPYTLRVRDRRPTGRRAPWAGSGQSLGPFPKGDAKKTDDVEPGWA
jgi:hypothetical protein